MRRVSRTIPVRTVNPLRVSPGNTEWLKGWCQNEDVFVVAAGPSLKEFDFKRLEGRRVIAINRAMFYCDPDIACMIDGDMGKIVREEFGHPRNAPFRFVAGHYSGLPSGENVAIVRIGNSLNTETLNEVLGRQSSTMLGISVGLIGKARTIYLLGLDAGFQSGRGHFHSDKWPDRNDNDEKKYQAQSKIFDAFLPWRDKIINLNPKSNVKTFRFGNIDEVLK